MPDVRSTVMTFVQYDDDARELDITFTSGKVYRYLRVPPEVYEELLEAESKGEYFNNRIKDEFAHAEVLRRLRRD